MEDPNSSGHRAHDAHESMTPIWSDSLAYLDDALEDAERLLKYAAEIGQIVDKDTRRHILQARAHRNTGWSEGGAANLLAALTTLSVQLNPVTAESLKACHKDQGQTVLGYWRWATRLAVVIVPFSLFGFVTSAISDGIRADIATANGLAVNLASQLHPQPSSAQASPQAKGAASSAEPPLPAGVAVVDVVTELQQFASIIRAVDNRARQLHLLVPFEQDPSQEFRSDPKKVHDRFQLPPDLPNHLTDAFNHRIEVYQDVRYFAQNLVADSSFVFGAITTFVLPVLYALLGTCAYLLRTFDQHMKNRTFIPSATDSAHFLIAGIGGGVVGLFNNFNVMQGATIPPLAVAFLVGYAVDVFFSFLESLMKAFTKSRSAANALTPASVSSSGRALVLSPDNRS